MAWKFRSTRSWLAGLASEFSSRPGPPPPAFARLPADATQAGYTVDLRTERLAPVRASLTDVVDAYLEHEKLGKGTRDHAKRLLTSMFSFAASAVQAKGSLPAETFNEAARNVGWRLARIELPIAEIDRTLDDMHALISDRALVKALAKRFDLDPKAPPKSELAPLKGKGVPAGARSLTITLSPALTEGLEKSTGRRPKADLKEPVKIVMVSAADGPTASVFVISPDKKDATERLRAYFAEGGKRLGARAELAALHVTRALHADFFSLAGLFDSLTNASSKSQAQRPSQGDTPIFASFTALAGPPLAFSASVTIPAAAFADAPDVILDASRTF
jgi:hypothetical protein